MTTKTLTGYYANGYQLKSGFSRLVIATSAKVVGGVAAGDAAIANYGTVEGGNYAGVYLLSGGSVNNGSATNKTALITGAYGVYISEFASPSGFVTNFGTIQGSVTYGVVLGAGGTVTNGSAADTTARIVGEYTGVLFKNDNGTVNNFGTIMGLISPPQPFYPAVGVYMLGSGKVTNGSAGDHAALIEGDTGILAYQNYAATVTNFGTIDGAAGYSVKFTYGTDRLIVESGSSLIGTAYGAGGTLELGGGSDTLTGLGGSAGTLSGGASGSLADFASYIVDSGASLKLAGSNTLNPGEILTVEGSASVTGVFTNLSAISSPNAVGVTVAAGGTVINGSASNTTASISGYVSGADATGASATIVNLDVISGAGRYGDGVDLGPGGRVTNGSATDSTASISGYDGVYATGAAGSAGVTVTNFGTISGESRTSISFSSSSDRLIVEAGSVLEGDAVGAGGTVELAGGSETISGLGSYGQMSGGASGGLYKFGSYLVDAGAVLTLTGTNSRTTAQTVTVAGSLINTGSLQATSRYDDGVDLSPGGRVTNGSATDSAALISGYIGVNATGAPNSAGATVTNYGTIDGTDRTSVALVSASDRLIVEAGSALIGDAVGAGGTLELAGGSETITGLGSYGVMTGGASAGGLYHFGAYLLDAGAVLTLSGTNTMATGQTLTIAGSLINTGSLQATSRADYGVYLSPGGAVTNGSATDKTALISGYIGVYTTGSAGSAGATVTNFGTISGESPTAVEFTSSSDRLIAEAGSVLVGVALGGGGTLELAGGSDKITGLGASGTLTGGATASFSGFGSYLVDAGTTLTLSGTNSLTAAQSMTVAGTLINDGALNNAGAPVILTAGAKVTNGTASNITALIAGGVSATGASDTITNYATISGSGGAAVTFGSSTDTLNAEAGSTFVGAVDAGAGTIDVVLGPVNFAGGVIAGGKVEGAGLMLLSGGTSVLGAGATLTVATIDVSGAATQVDVTGNLTDAKLWIQSAGTLSVGAGGVMHFTGSGNTFAGTLAGAGTVQFQSGSDTLNGASLTVAAVNIAAAATVTLSGAIDNAGNVASSTPNLIVAAGGATLTGVGTVTLGNSATNGIFGATSSATLTNVDNRIVGAGLLGGGEMVLINEAAGLINGNDSKALIIDTGANAIVNDGFIEATGAGGVTVDSAVVGTGSAQVTAGTLSFASTFSQNVAFGAAGVLQLADSKTYTGSISGFSKTGHTSLDLRDIGFVSSTEATFSGNSSGGVLTVTDGTNTAHITLVGNYIGSTFVASSDGHNGTIVIDPKAKAPVAAPHLFIAAMAGLGADQAGGAIHTGEAMSVRAPVLAIPER